MKSVTLGVDIGGTNSVFGLVSKNGNLLVHFTVPTVANGSPTHLASYIENTVNDYLNEHPEINLKGIGIGAPNGNYFTGEIAFAPNLPWKGVIPLVSIFKQAFNLPTFITNDANAAGIGEMLYGNAKNTKNFIMVTLGTGLGTGFVVNNEMVYGHDGFAGELGHVIVEKNGRLCGCGRKGCLEQYASARGIVKTAKVALSNNKNEIAPSLLMENNLTAIKIHEAACANDALALKIFDTTADYLGMALANCVAITSPDKIILFGGLANAGDVLLTPLKKYFETYLLNIYQNKVSIEISSLNKKNAAILGASALAWKELNKHEEQ